MIASHIVGSENRAISISEQASEQEIQVVYATRLPLAFVVLIPTSRLQWNMKQTASIRDLIRSSSDSSVKDLGKTQKKQAHRAPRIALHDISRNKASCKLIISTEKNSREIIFLTTPLTKFPMHMGVRCLQSSLFAIFQVPSQLFRLRFRPLHHQGRGVQPKTTQG